MKVTILGVPFEVVRTSSAALEEMTGMHDAAGWCDDENNVIHIRDNLIDKYSKLIFVHEWVHGVLGVSGINQIMKAQLEETICQSIANAFLQILDQKEAMEFLTKK